MSSFSQQQSNISKTIITVIVFVLMSIIVLFVLFSYYTQLPTTNNEQRVTIPEGASLIKTATILENNNVIRSALVLRVLGQMNDISVKAGTYAFDNTTRTVSELLVRLDTSDYGDVYTTVTFPEGITREQIATILAAADLPNISTEKFLELTQGKEGYLFPDTYQFLPESDTQLVVDTLELVFSERTKEIQSLRTNRSWADIVTMASIIEREAGDDEEEQKIVAGILWKRIDQGIPLQVDAPFVYAIGKGSAELRTADLRADGPYNTYTRKGLTPTPIGNPGISALRAAIDPTKTLYYFYLHDTKGGIHYGITHADHIRNKQQYL